MSRRFILTAAEMRAAEAAAVEAGTPVETLMERAGTAAAEAIRRFAGPMPTLVLCGPGNNGGDGYVVARRLQEYGFPVRVAALRAPRDGAARAAAEGWDGPVRSIEDAQPAALLVDALFGTGLTRGLDPALAARLCALAEAARVRVAVDLPSGAATDDGALLSPVPGFDLTISFATLKPSHRLQPAAAQMGRIVVADIGVGATSDLHEIARPSLPAPAADAHKYTRGYVAMLAGGMAGAAALAAAAALRAGAGYVALLAPKPVPSVPHAIVQRSGDPGAFLADSRIGAAAIGPGLGTGEDARAVLDTALAAPHPLVLDADALKLLAGEGTEALRRCTHAPILTPHEGEFARLFPNLTGSKIERARAAAAAAGAVVVYKGADTVVAALDGRAAVGAGGSSWLASAGSGDVLTGVVAAMLARGLRPFEAASAAVWLHARAAQLAGPGLIADDLLAALPSALAECA